MKRLARRLSLADIMMVIFVLAILATLVITNTSSDPQKTYFNRTIAEFTTLANALKQYVAKYNDYPADVGRGLPAGIKEFIAKDAQSPDWPNAPYPDSVYDYDRWDDLQGVDTYQISVRFCPSGGPLSACKFPKQPWVTPDWGVSSAMYYCIKGNCRSHQAAPAAYPGYCVNCPGNKAIGT